MTVGSTEQIEDSCSIYWLYFCIVLTKDAMLSCIFIMFCNRMYKKFKTLHNKDIPPLLCWILGMWKLIINKSYIYMSLNAQPYLQLQFTDYMCLPLCTGLLLCDNWQQGNIIYIGQVPKSPILMPKRRLISFRNEPFCAEGETIRHDARSDLPKSWGSLLANANHTAVPVK